jgi:hypothetical protein
MRALLDGANVKYGQTSLLDLTYMISRLDIKAHSSDIAWNLLGDDDRQTLMRMGAEYVLGI